MAQLRAWLERLIEAHCAARDARLFARIVDERAARRTAAKLLDQARVATQR
jgi:hypothetical protein